MKRPFAGKGNKKNQHTAIYRQEMFRNSVNIMLVRRLLQKASTLCRHFIAQQPMLHCVVCFIMRAISLWLALATAATPMAEMHTCVVRSHSRCARCHRARELSLLLSEQCGCGKPLRQLASVTTAKSLSYRLLLAASSRLISLAHSPIFPIFANRNI